MIGRIRAAWDDSRRTANHRRGTNPMSRAEWFEFVDRLNTEVVDKINALPTRETIRRAADQIRADLRVASDKPARGCECVSVGLERRGSGREFDDDRSARAEEKDNVAEISSDGVTNRGRVLRLGDPVDAGTDVLGGLGVDLDRAATDVDQSRCLCAIRKLDDSRLTHDGAPSIDGGRRTIGNGQASGTPFARAEILATGLDEVFSKAAPEPDDSFPVADLDRFTAAQNADAEESAVEYQEFLALRRPSAQTSAFGVPASGGGLRGLGAVGFLEGERHVVSGVFADQESEGTLGGGDLHVEKLTVQLDRLTRAVEELNRNRRVHPEEVPREFTFAVGAEDSKRKATAFAETVLRDSLDVGEIPVVLPESVVGAVVDESRHNASPSAVDGGAHSVGEGSVAGVETAAPVTDATDVFAGPGLFRFDGTQAHMAEPSQPTATTTKQIADVLEELHNQGRSWHEIARLTRRIFTALASPS